jgi:hypothetical protein
LGSLVDWTWLNRISSVENSKIEKVRKKTGENQKRISENWG